MKRVKPVSRYRGIGDVTHEAKPVARVSYDLHCGRTMDAARATAHEVIEGDIQVLNGQASLYTDELYTLHLEARHGRECDFYTEPVDVVTGVYHFRGHRDFRELARRHRQKGELYSREVRPAAL
jgi:hypothetical protein